MNKLYVVGIGPGAYDQMTVQAVNTLQNSDIIVGYTVYTDIVHQYFPGKEILSTPMTGEVKRCQMAFQEAEKGKTVSIVCSGDAGIYGMAGLVLEMNYRYESVCVQIISGVTAAESGAALLGAPICHDFAVVSLSDLLTPWEKIEKRLRSAAEADFVICLYNPSSKKRADYLEKACRIVLEYAAMNTVCAITKNIGRDGESYKIMTLEQLEHTNVNMFTTVYIGNSQTKNVCGKMITPRGYENV